ncbi:MAG: fatty acid hydroxylase family protein [Pseudomonadales bacterium]|nr:fatty acid hydroxylase family protein [Pseudomonadales bacterium]
MTQQVPTGPISELVEIVLPLLADNLPAALAWQTIAITLLLASGIFFLRRGRGAKNAEGRMQEMPFLQFLLPKDVYTHESARVDIWLWILERLLRPLWIGLLLVSVGPFIESGLMSLLQTSFGSSPELAPHYAWMLLYSLIVLLFYDAFFYAIHYTMHKVPAFWAIHKVHHSAEVLTPLTRTREHFIAGPIWAAGAALGFAIPGAFFAYLFDGQLNQATLLGMGLFAFLFGLTGNFRHYHIALHYPNWLCMWLQSPAMHHTHHSYLDKHRDTNLAAVTSVFDRMFGTFYIPEKDEYTPWGLGPETQDECRSFQQNVAAPFKEWAALAKRSPRPFPKDKPDA